MLSKYVWDNIGQENYLCNVDLECTEMFSQENNLYNLLWSAWVNIAQKNYLCNIDPQPMNNFAQENNLQRSVDQCGPTLPKEVTCTILAHGWQTIFLSKITCTMLCLSSRDNIANEYRLLIVI